MNDSELNELLSRFKDGYNAPPANPPLAEIKARIHAARSRSTNIRRGAMGLFAAAAVALLAIGITRPSPRNAADKPALEIARDTNRGAVKPSHDPRATMANAALASAIQSAEKAVQENPDDPYFREHLQAMRENAEQFERLQQRQTSGTL